MATLQFPALMEISGVNPFVFVSAERASKLRRSWRKPMPVLVQIDGKPEKPWRINMMPVGNGNFRLCLHAEVRKASRTRVGDRVKVEISFDTSYRNGPMHPMPSWFRVALGNNPPAKRNWDALVPSRKKEILRYFSWLKSEQTRERNLARAIHVLSGKPGRFMGRSWSGGR